MFTSTLRRTRKSRASVCVVLLAERGLVTAVKSSEEALSRQHAQQQFSAARKKYPILGSTSIKFSRPAYVLDETMAEEIVKMIRHNQGNPDVPVVEANPGPGVVTRALLESGVPHVALVEKFKDFIPHLQTLQKEVGAERVSLIHLNLFSWWSRKDGKLMNMGNDDRVLSLLPALSPPPSGPSLTVYGVLPNMLKNIYLKHILDTMRLRYGFFAYGQPEWFLILPPNVYKQILQVRAKAEGGGPDYPRYYTPLGILLTTMFHTHLCGQFPAWKFCPPVQEKKLKTKQEFEGVTESMLPMLRLRVQEDPVIQPEQIQQYFKFLSQLMSTKNKRVIPTMEKFVPGCGVRLIMGGFTMLDHMHQMSPQQFATIFKMMQTWPEFHGSPIKQHFSEDILDETDIATVDEALPSAVDEAYPSTVDGAYPSTVDEAYSSTAHEAYPSTAHETYPSTAHEAYPSTAHEAYPSTAHEAHPSSTVVARPLTANEARPCPADEARPSTANEARLSTVNDACPPTADEARSSTANEARPCPTDEAHPSTANEGHSSNEAQPSTADEGRHSTANETQPSTADEAQPSTANEGHSSNEAQPSTANETQPSTADEAQPSTADEAQPSTDDEAHPSTADEAQPSTADEAHPSTADEAQPSTADEAQPSTDDNSSLKIVTDESLLDTGIDHNRFDVALKKKI